MKRLTLAAAILLLAVPAFAQGQGDWAAIAYGVGKGAKATGQSSREAARAKAQSECGADCKVYAIAKGNCAAIAVSARGSQFYAPGTALNQAESEAMGKCAAAQKSRGANCSVGISHCNL